MSRKARLIGGPADGETVTADVECTAIPLDQSLGLLKDKSEPFAWGIYRLEHKGSQAFYRFSHVQRHPDPTKGFDIEFVDGPLQGIQPFAQAIQFFDSVFRVPIGVDGKPLQSGSKVGSVAEYGRKMIDGTWKMALIRTINDPEEIESMADTLAEQALTRNLQSYTSEQLIRELTNRPTFYGLVITFPSEGKFPQKGDHFALHIGKSIKPHDAAVILRSALDSIPGA